MDWTKNDGKEVSSINWEGQKDGKAEKPKKEC